MEFNRQRLRLAFGLAAFALSVTACHGSPSGNASYVPASSTGISMPDNAGLSPDDRGDIISSCGHHIRIIIAGIVNCRFREAGGRNIPAKFTLSDHTNGLILISPKSGNQHTKFTITGLVVGTGYFVVKDNHGNSLRITVRVHL